MQSRVIEWNWKARGHHTIILGNKERTKRSLFHYLFYFSLHHCRNKQANILNFTSLHSMLSLCGNLPTIIAMFTSLHVFTISMLQLYMLWGKMWRSMIWTWEVVLLRILTMSLATRIFLSCLCKNMLFHKLKTNTSLIQLHWSSQFCQDLWKLVIPFNY